MKAEHCWQQRGGKRKKSSSNCNADQEVQPSLMIMRWMKTHPMHQPVCKVVCIAKVAGDFAKIGTWSVCISDRVFGCRATLVAEGMNKIFILVLCLIWTLFATGHWPIFCRHFCAAVAIMFCSVILLENRF